jgi:NitT/TauT family transport system permease protein
MGGIKILTPIKFKTRTLIILLLVAVLLLVVLFVWEIAAQREPRLGFLFGRPSLIFSELWSIVKTGEFFSNFFVTGAEALIGTILGTFIGCSLGISLWLSRDIALAVRPIAFALGNLPIFAFAPLMIVWFGTDFTMKVVLAALSTGFVSFSLAYRGAQGAGKEPLELLTAMKASKRHIFLKVIVPASLDSVFQAARLNVGFGLLGAFIGEFISSDKGLGYLILKASGLYNVSRVFAVSFGILLLAIVFDAAAAYLERRSSYIMQFISVPKDFR